MGKITEEQEGIIRQYSCERLSSHPENKTLLSLFSSERGKQLVLYLKEYAWDEDVQSHTAYYLVKSPSGEPVLFFSLKCGALFSRIDEKELIQRQNDIHKLLELLQENTDGDAQDDTQQVIEFLRSGNAPIAAIRDRIEQKHQKNKDILHSIELDRKREWNTQNIQVRKTFPGIEIVHFCASDTVKNEWSTYGFRYSFGEVMFWYHIAPIIYETQEKIGCQYVFLFAADTSADGTLVNYYDVSLKFQKPNDIGTSKPQYDFCCEFMCQEIANLKRNRQSFFENFNPDIDEIIV